MQTRDNGTAQPAVKQSQDQCGGHKAGKWRNDRISNTSSHRRGRRLPSSQCPHNYLINTRRSLACSTVTIYRQSRLRLAFRKPLGPEDSRGLSGLRELKALGVLRVLMVLRWTRGLRDLRS